MVSWAILRKLPKSKPIIDAFTLLVAAAWTFFLYLVVAAWDFEVKLSFNGSDLKTFLRKIINSLMFLDHSHIISSLANQKKKYSKANLTPYLPQVLLTWRPNPAGQFLDISNPAGQFFYYSNPTGQFQHYQIKNFFFFWFAKLEMMWKWSRNIKLLITILRKVFKLEPLKEINWSRPLPSPATFVNSALSGNCSAGLETW